MTVAQPLTDTIEFNVDLVAVDKFSVTVRDRANGQQHTLGFDGLAIGANESGGGYTLILPRVLAQMQGLADVQ